MNWKRIKTILIFALIAINILLGYTLHEDRKMENGVASIEREQIAGLFAQKGIVLPKDIFDVSLEISNLEVELSSYDLEVMESVFKEYATDDVSNPATIFSENKLKYSVKYGVLDASVLPEDVLLKNAYALIEKLGFSDEDIVLNEIGRTGKKVIFKFDQIVDGSILTDSHMIISFNNENLIKFERLWYDIVSINDYDKSFYSPEYALYAFLGQEYDRNPNRKKDISVQSLKLVYKLSSGSDTNGLNRVVGGEATIYWEIKTSGEKNSYYVNAIKD